MDLHEAKGYVNQTVRLAWMDRKGQEQEGVAAIFAVEFVPLYGPCLITSEGDIRLDRVVRCTVEQARKAG